MTAALTIRPATEHDVEQIWQVHTRAVGTTCRTHYPDTVVIAWMARLKPESYRAVVRRAVVLLAELDGHVVGFSQVDLNEAEVQAVYVLPEMEGRGIGGTLLSAAEAAAAEHGLPRLTLKATLNAEDFYARRGWRAVTADVHKITEEISLTCIAMEKDIATPSLTRLPG
jgi:putative acetyltransferase